MPRVIIMPLLAVLAVAAVALLSGCNGDDDKASSTEAATNAEKEARKEVTRRIKAEGRRQRAAQRRAEARKNRTPAQRAAAERRSRRRAAAARERDREADRKADREFDKGFAETAFDRLIAKLPIRKPPLYVAQYITSTGSHRVYTAVDRSRFLCRMSPAQRQRAVAAFFRAADRVMRAGGVDDFVQVVTVTSQATQELPALANARRGSVALTERGRERNPC
jgi:hypothetical protein